MGAFLGPGTTFDSYMVDSSRSIGVEIPFLKAPWNFIRRFCLPSAGWLGWTTSRAESWLVSWVERDPSTLSNSCDKSERGNAALLSAWPGLVAPSPRSTEAAAVEEREPRVLALEKGTLPLLKRAERPWNKKCDKMFWVRGKPLGN